MSRNGPDDFSPYVIETSPLRKSYQTRRGSAAGGRGTAEAGEPSSDIVFPSLRIRRGGLVAIMGSSGVGKSTLLNLLAGLDEPEPVDSAAGCWIELNLRAAGRVEAFEIVADQASIPRHRIGFVFQQGHLLSNATVGLNIGLPGIVHRRALERLGRPAAGDGDVLALLKRLSLETRSETADDTRLKRAWQLSGGQAQRVAFARAIAHNPDIIFADEPTSGLDDENAMGLLRLLKEWLAENPDRTVLWVTHQKHLAEVLADCVLHLDRYEEDKAGALLLEPERNSLAKRLPPSPEPGGGPATARAPSADVGRTTLAVKLAASEMFSDRRALGDVERQRPLSRSLARIGRSGARVRAVLSALPAMRRAFRDWSTSILFLLSGLLLFIAIAGFLANRHFADRALSDPLACRMEVLRKAGQAQRPFSRAEIDGRLAPRPWVAQTDEEKKRRLQYREGFGFAAASCRNGPGVFGRSTEVGWGLGAVIDGKCITDLLVEARILVATRNEPMFDRVYLVDQRGKKGRSLHQMLFDQSYFPQRDLFLDYDRYESLREKVKARLQPGQRFEQVCLVEGLDQASVESAEKFPFELAGVVEDIPAGGRRRYDVYMPDDTHQAWLTARRSQRRDFDSAMFYFDPFHYEAINTFLLDPRNGEFNYNAEDIRKVQQRVYVFIATMVSITVLCGVILLILAFYLRNWFQYYIEVNARPLAVLVAYGVEARLLRRVVLLRALGNLGVGLLTLVFWASVAFGVLAAIWLWLARDAASRSAYLEALRGIGEGIEPMSLAVGGAVSIVLGIAAMALLVWFMARRAVGGWYRENRYVAPILA